MKTLLQLSLIFALSGCSFQRKWPFFALRKHEVPSQPESSKASRRQVTDSKESAPKTPSEPCHISLSADDNQHYSLNTLRIDTSCETVDIAFSHTGKIPKKTDGHNLVVAKKEDLIYLVKRAASNREFDYSPRSSRTVISTELIGGGESVEVSLNPSDFDKNLNYVFFCSFPGHYKNMQGPLEFY